MKRKKIKYSNTRINLIFACVVCVQTLFIARLFHIQVIKHDEYKALANEQHWDLQDLPASRGKILSRDGYPLATNQTAYLLFASPKKIEDPLDTAHKLAAVVSDLKAQDDKEKLQLHTYYKEKYYAALQHDLYWVSLEKDLSIFDKDRIEKADIKGIGFEEGFVRLYPEGNLAAHALGYVASDSTGEKRGYFGVEGYFDGELKGKSGRIIEERDATGAPILVGGYKRVDPIQGRDIVLTIDRAVQYIAEKRLKEGIDNYGAQSGSVIVMNPINGDVLAMANYPSYDPTEFEDLSEDYEEGEEKIQRRNLSISKTYEPGSVIKPLTVAAGIDLGKITPESTFVDNGPVAYSGYTINNWDERHHGVQTVRELLQKSNNIGAAWVGHIVGAYNLHDYFSRFGFGTRTLVNLEGEDTGTIRQPDEWTDIDLATASFGQGISATPLQVLNAFNALANGGVLLQPRVVLQVVEEDKQIDLVSKEIRQVVTKDTAETMVALLTDAVSGGESKYFNIKDYKIAGKTGTAQIPVDGKYDPSKTNVTFVGFLPTSRRFSMLVMLTEPSSSTYASETAVPLWMALTEDLVKYFGIPPDTI